MADVDTGVARGPGTAQPPEELEPLFPEREEIVLVDPPATGPDEPPAAPGEDIIRLQLTHMGIVLAATVVIAAIGFFLLGNAGDGLSIAYPILLAGALGGTANTVRRVQQLAREPVTVLAEVPRSLAVAQIYLSSVIGGGFGVLLYLVFLGGMLQGEFFPAFDCGGEPFTTYGEFSLCSPTTNADTALALVWAFLAGFAERFVPSMLDRFVEHDEDDG